MDILFIAFFASTLSSLAGLTGGFLLLWKEGLARRWSLLLVSFAAGTMLGAAFLDLLKEALGNAAEPTALLPYLLAGILLFFLIEKFLIFHHHMHRTEVEGTHDHETIHEEQIASRQKVLRSLVIFGDATHNFIDGIIIAATFSVSIPLGVITSLAVFFHELPQEIGDFSILLHSGMTKKRVALWNLLGALVSPIGTVVGFYALSFFTNIQLPMIAVAAGGFIYIAGSDLIPEINHETRWRHILTQVVLLFLGIAAIWFVGTLLPEGG